MQDGCISEPRTQSLFGTRRIKKQLTSPRNDERVKQGKAVGADRVEIHDPIASVDAYIDSFDTACRENIRNKRNCRISVAEGFIF